MYATTAALALMWAMMFGSPQDAPSPAPAQDPAVQAPITSVTPDGAVAYQNAVDGDWGEADTPEEFRAEEAAFGTSEPRWSARVTLYHAGGGGATGNDSLGCRPIAMRTVATDPRYIPRRTRIFIPETVGMRAPDGSEHDGYWYATDTGGAVKGQKIDLYTGHGRASMQPAMRFNTRTVRIAEAGRFDGCPPAW